MASKQNEENAASAPVHTSDHEGTAPVRDEFETVANPSQTLPLITEELAATRASTDAFVTGDHLAAGPSTTSPATTPVMPPNPIRTETVPHLPETVLEPESGPASTNGTAEKKEKSEGRVSATQLLAGAAAAATSSVIGGQLGVAGTVVGAGIASIITGLAVTLYTSSLDKGREKFKEVGSKLGPAVKAKSLRAKMPRTAETAETARTTVTFGSLSSEAANGTTEGHGGPDSGETTSWWQKLRRKRVLYPVTIGVATFGIGLGAVVMAESLTDADISPGTSQISRSVTGDSGAGDESGSSDVGGGADDQGSSGSGSQTGQNPNQGRGDENSTTADGQSTSASEGGSDTTSTADQTGTEADSSSASGDDSAGAGNGSSGTGADASGGQANSSDASSNSGAQGGAGGSDSGSGSSSGGGSGNGAGSGSGSSSAGGGSSATAQG